MLRSRGAVALATLLTAGWLYTAASATVEAAGEGSIKLDMWRPGDAGERLLMRGRVSTAAGAPVANAQLHVRQADGTGTYTAQYQGTLTTGPDGSYAFGTVLPGQYSSTKHIHVVVTHPDHGDVFTEIRFKGDPNLAGGAYDDNAIVTEEANIDGARVLLGEFNIVLQR